VGANLQTTIHIIKSNGCGLNKVEDLYERAEKFNRWKTDNRSSSNTYFAKNRQIAVKNHHITRSV